MHQQPIRELIADKTPDEREGPMSEGRTSEERGVSEANPTGLSILLYENIIQHNYHHKNLLTKNIKPIKGNIWKS